MDSPTTLGNRLSLPNSVPGAHLMYLADPAPVAPQDMQLLAQAVQAYVHDTGLDAAQIELLTEKDQNRLFDEPALQARDRLVQALGWGHLPAHQRSIIFCEWAPPHVDDFYAGKAFVSLVLHTGPEPYLMQTFHTSAGGPETPASTLQLMQTSRLLRPGDLMVLDPTTPHMAAPVRSNNEALLILLQAEWPDEDEAQRHALVQRFEPTADNQEADLTLL